MTGGIAFLVYFLTLAPDLTWANAAYDGGELITASMTLGIPHPPGYPTYIWLGKLFSTLPIGTIAFRYNIFSALCTASAISLLVLAIRHTWHLSVRPVVAAALALTAAFSPLIWSQAVVAEVYALNLLFVSAFLLVLIWRGVGFGSGILFGLALTSHITSVFLLPLALLSPARQNWRRFVAGIAIGLFPLLSLPYLATGVSPVIWGDATTLSGWWWLITARLYVSNLQWPIDPDRLSLLITSLIAGPGLIIASSKQFFVAQIQSNHILSPAWRIRIGLTASIVLYGCFAVLYQTPDAPILLLPAILLLALLLVPIFQPLGHYALLMPFALLVIGFPTQNLRDDVPIRPIAESTLMAAPEQAILLSPGDRTIFTLWYFHHVEGLRPDLHLVDMNLFAFDWYRARLGVQYPGLWLPTTDDLNEFQIKNLERYPICRVSLVTHNSIQSAGQKTSSTMPALDCMESFR